MLWHIKMDLQKIGCGLVEDGWDFLGQLSNYQQAINNYQ
jgi:hypothetical protein